MQIVLLRQGVLREPAAECGVVEAGTEVVDVEGCGGLPVLALVLFGLEGRVGACGQRPAQRVVVVRFEDRAGIVHDGADRAQVVPDEMASGGVARGQVDVSAVEPQAPGGAGGAAHLLQHQVSAPVEGSGRRGRPFLDGPHFAEFGAVGGIVVIDRRSVGEGDLLRKVDLVPGDGGDAFVGVRDKSPVGVVGVFGSHGCAVMEVEASAVGFAGDAVHDPLDVVARPGDVEAVDASPGGWAGAAETLHGDNVAVAVVGGDAFGVVVVGRGSFLEVGGFQAVQAVVGEGVALAGVAGAALPSGSGDVGAEGVGEVLMET